MSHADIEAARVREARLALQAAKTLQTRLNTMGFDATSELHKASRIAHDALTVVLRNAKRRMHLAMREED